MGIPRAVNIHEVHANEMSEPGIDHGCQHRFTWTAPCKQPSISASDYHIISRSADPCECRDE